MDEFCPKNFLSQILREIKLHLKKKDNDKISSAPCWMNGSYTILSVRRLVFCFGVKSEIFVPSILGGKEYPKSP